MSQTLEVIRTALRSLTRNAMRSALTALGMVIGVAAVIVMIEIGQGSARVIQEMIARMGADNLMIKGGAASSAGVSRGGGSENTLTLQDVATLELECADILDRVAPMLHARTQVVYGNKNWVPRYVYGTTPDYLEIRSWEIDDGAAFTDQDVRNGVQVCLLGQTIVREMFEGQSPVGRNVRINNQPFRVIGTLVAKGASMFGFDQDDLIIAPLSAVKQKVAGSSVVEANQSAAVAADPTQVVNSLSERYPGVYVTLYPVPSASQKANHPQIDRQSTVDTVWVHLTGGSKSTATRRIESILHRLHNIREGEINDFTVRDLTEEGEAMGSSSEKMSTLLLAVALISLVVGGVGIMNIMLVSVTERTREIGLRMAVGARPGDILLQFLVEAVILCLVGGAIGILLGRGSSIAARVFLNWSVEPSAWAVVASVSVSVAVGLVFGYYPAWKASRLDPIQALRYE